MEISPEPSAPALSPTNTPNSISSVTSVSSVTLLNQLLDEIYHYNESQLLNPTIFTKLDQDDTGEDGKKEKSASSSSSSALASPNQSTSEDSNENGNTWTTSSYFGSSTCTRVRVLSPSEYTRENLLKKSKFFLSIFVKNVYKLKVYEMTFFMHKKLKFCCRIILLLINLILMCF